MNMTQHMIDAVDLICLFNLSILNVRGIAPVPSCKHSKPRGHCSQIPFQHIWSLSQNTQRWASGLIKFTPLNSHLIYIDFNTTGSHTGPGTAGGRIQHQFRHLVLRTESAYLFRRGQRGILETLVLDHHFRPGLCLLYDLVHGAEHVPDRRKVKATYASSLWRKVDLLPGYSTFYDHLPFACIRHHYPTFLWSQREKEEIAGQAWSEWDLGAELVLARDVHKLLIARIIIMQGSNK